MRPKKLLPTRNETIKPTMEWNDAVSFGCFFFYVSLAMNHIKQFQSPQKASLFSFLLLTPSFPAWWVNNNEGIGLCHNRENVVSFSFISAWNAVIALRSFFCRFYTHIVIGWIKQIVDISSATFIPSIVNFRIEKFCLMRKQETCKIFEASNKLF